MNPTLEAWSGKGLSVLASRIGTPLIMDTMTTSMCNKGIGILGYARVLVEVNAKKDLWIILIVFGHTNSRCAKMDIQKGKGQEKVKMTEGFVHVTNKRKSKNDGVHTVEKNISNTSEYYKTPIKSQKKVWHVDDNVIKDVRSTTNKFSILQEVEKESLNLKLNKKEKEEVGRYYSNDKGNEGIDVDYETDIELDENDVYVDKSAYNIRGLGKVTKQNEIKNLIRNERLSICAVLETHMKKDRIGKVSMDIFGSWAWQNNVDFSRKSCRIAVGLDASNVSCSLINATAQSMLYKVNVLSNQNTFYCTFIYVANKGRDKRDLWKELNLNKRVVGDSAWVIMGYVNVSLNLEDHSEVLKPHLNKLNWKNGNLFEKVADLKIKLFNVQRKIDLDPSNKDIRNEGVELLREYKEATMDEEKLLRQKAKVTWLREGDKNSAYFHTVLKGRINRNRIMSVCAEDGRRYKNYDVAGQFVKHFKGFLGINPPVTKLTIKDAYLFDKKISKTKATIMTRDVSDEEIKIALFDIDDDKAPGPDGYTSKFYKKAWNVIKGEFCAAINEFFLTGKLLGGINATLISLFPKSMTPKRIKYALNQIVDENQSAFVPGRAITDNILLTQELLKGYNCINGPKRCSSKIEIQKAYDIVSWSFIDKVLRHFGFPEKMIRWIMTCISTPKFTIYVNGERFSYFRGGRGMRQGDPISPYIFTMVMEMINLVVKDEIRKKKAFKFHFGCKQLRITHLCFVDDLIMFCHGDSVSVQTLKKALDKFSAITGLHPNIEKCTMFCGSLEDETKSAISSIFPFRDGKLPVRYLGVPLVTKKIGVSYCKQLVDKVNQRLNDWKNKSLSYARRAQLIASVLGSMQVYWGSVFLLPKTVINDIERLFKKFLWNSGDSGKGRAKVAWLDMCKPKD
ncbi:RNA-directed DNA polymerase, eukaryota, reverse transcriptase zinc-binding domain protein [Tanacetum coccineum]